MVEVSEKTLETLKRNTKAFTQWAELLKWLESRKNVPHYVYHYFERRRGKPYYWWMISIVALPIGKNHTVMYGNLKVEKEKRRVAVKAKKERNKALSKEPFHTRGFDPYPKHPQRKSYEERMTERDAIDEAERVGEIEELEESLEEKWGSEAWKIKRL